MSDTSSVDIPGFALSLRALCLPGARVLLTGPMDPDGDSIGACLALQRGLRAVTDADVQVAGEPGKRYAWVPGADAMVGDAALEAMGSAEGSLPVDAEGSLSVDAEGSTPWDLVVVLDGDRHRLVAGADTAFQTASARGIVDHHRSTTEEGYDVALVDPTAASTCELVYGVLQAWGVPLDADLAALLYTGVVFDTGGFRHSNASPETHRFAAVLLEQGIDHAAIALRVLAERGHAGFRLLGDVIGRTRFFANSQVAIASVPQRVMQRLDAVNEDIEGIVDTLLVTRGVETACLLVEKPDGRVKLSLRSRSRVDVAALAAGLAPGGGCHARAAGVMLAGPLDAAWQQVPPALVAATTSE